MLSLRYLRARRREGFISVIAGFSFLGIMLGVATLIIVMAVMNGFRTELLDKILGLNGHLLIQPIESPLTDWDRGGRAHLQMPGVHLAAPIVEGQALASSPFNSDRRAGAWHARPPTSPSSARSPRTSSRARWTASTKGRGWPSAVGSLKSCRCVPATTSPWWRRAAR